MQWEIGEKRILETLSSIPLDYHNCKGAHIKSSPGCAGIVYLQPTHIPLQPPLIFSPYISTPQSQFLQFYSYVLLKVLYILGELSATENSQLLRMLFSTRLMSRWTLCLGV